MARGRSRKAPGALAPSLELVVRALEEHYRENGLRRGEADALRALGELAASQVPTRGVFASSESDLDMAIDRVATKHLGFKSPRKEFVGATAEVEAFALRDRIETSANHMRIVSDTAQFYAGLAFGVTLVEFREIESRRRRSRG
jgi:hypothetical protein